MLSGRPFSRVMALMSAIAATMQLHPAPGVAQQQALNALPAYTSRGKGGRQATRSVGTKAFQRAAAKRRNQKRSH